MFVGVARRTWWGNTVDAGDPAFVIRVKTDNVGTSASNQFTLPMIAGTYDVDWGDGNVDTSQTGTQTHTYASAGTYDIRVTGGTQFQFNFAGDPNKLIDIRNWGNSEWTSMFGAFGGCGELTTVSAQDAPDLSVAGGISCFRMFRSCLKLVSIPNAAAWDMSNVNTTGDMFYLCRLVDFDSSTWVLSQATTAANMFYDARAFTGDLGNLGLGNCLSIAQMMYKCLAWDGAGASNWTVTQMTNMLDFAASSTTMSTANYDALLIAWEAQGTMSYAGTVNMGLSQYTSGGAAETARTNLIAEWGGITDGGAAP